MSRFEETVAKIASCPVKSRLFYSIPGEILQKEAAASSPRGVMAEIGIDVAKKAIGAGVVGAGAFGLSRLVGRMFGNQDENDARHEETGKLTAQKDFKTMSLLRLQPQHANVFKTVMKDDVIRGADHSLMKSTYDTMKRFAPNLAADDNAARSFLREHAIYGAGPSYAALKNLADAERAVASAGGI